MGLGSRSIVSSFLSVSIVFLAACSESDPISPDQATASLAATTSTQITGTVGQPVAVVPAVKAVDAGGNPVSGLNVTFQMTGGGSLGRTTATTDATGTASAGSWTLGTASGEQTVTATAGSRAVTFKAVAAAGAPSGIASVTGNISAQTGAAVTTKPSVKITDQYGNAVAGIPVTFSVVNGGGSVTGATVTTDATGTATVGGWTLGVTPGTQTLRATAGTLTLTFTATATLPSGCVVAPYAIGASVTGTWATGDCANSSAYAAQGASYDQYELNLTSQQNVKFELTATTGSTLRIKRKGTTDDYVALPLGAGFVTVNGNTLTQRNFLAAGNYIVEVQAPANTTGNYTLNSVVDDSDIVCRPVVQGSIGITFSGALNESTDCPSPVAPGTVEDWIVMPLKTGDKFRITLTTTTMPAGFVLRDDRQGPASPTLAVRSSTTAGTVTLDWTATFDSYHEIVIFKNAGPNVPYGSYTIKIERL